MKHRLIAYEDREVISNVRCLEPEAITVMRYGGAHIANGEGRDRLVHASRRTANEGRHGDSLAFVKPGSKSPRQTWDSIPSPARPRPLHSPWPGHGPDSLAPQQRDGRPAGRPCHSSQRDRFIPRRLA